MNFENGRAQEQLVQKSGVELIEAELGLSMKEATVTQVLEATATVLKSYEKKANNNGGVLEMSDLDRIEEVACTRKMYEAMADAQKTYKSLVSRLKNVPIPDLIANDNSVEQSRVAA